MVNARHPCFYGVQGWPMCSQRGPQSPSCHGLNSLVAYTPSGAQGCSHSDIYCLDVLSTGDVCVPKVSFCSPDEWILNGFYPFISGVICRPLGAWEHQGISLPIWLLIDWTPERVAFHQTGQEHSSVTIRPKSFFPGQNFPTQLKFC